MTPKKTYRIALKVGGSVKDVCNIEYTADGGFFFQDKVRLNFDQKRCMVVKLQTDVEHHGTATREPTYRAFTSGDVKLTHHIDGRSHISGTGVISGYNSDASPKGAAVLSFPLTVSNDGGMFWSISLWGFDSLRDATKADIVLTPDDRYIHSRHIGKTLKTYVVKGFYMLKEWLPEEVLAMEVITINSREGNVDVTLVPSPPNCPGVIGLLATKGVWGGSSEYGFTMGGAPGYIDEEGFCDGLYIVYPDTETGLEGISLDKK